MCAKLFMNLKSAHRKISRSMNSHKFWKSIYSESMSAKLVFFILNKELHKERIKVACFNNLCRSSDCDRIALETQVLWTHTNSYIYYWYFWLWALHLCVLSLFGTRVVLFQGGGGLLCFAFLFFSNSSCISESRPSGGVNSKKTHRRLSEFLPSWAEVVFDANVSAL